MDVFEEAKQLSRVPLFAQLEFSRLKLLAFTSERIILEDGEFLFHLNDISDSVYLLLEGMVQVVIEHESGLIEPLLNRYENDLLGEMGVISNTPRSASIRASGTSVLLQIQADNFMDLLTENSSMSLYVVRELTYRLNQYVTRERQEALAQGYDG